MLKVVLALTMLFASLGAFACSPAIPLDTTEARQAKNVFVFRVLSVRADADREFMAVGTIRVLANVRGTTTATALEYPTGWCGGVSFDPGIDYIGFLPSDTQVLEASATNVVPLFFGRYDRQIADKLEAVLRGKRSLEESFGNLWDASPRAPRPPPQPPCPDAGPAGP